MAVPQWNGVGTEFEVLDSLTLEAIYKLTVKTVTTQPTSSTQGECEVFCEAIDKTRSSYPNIKNKYQMTCTVDWYGIQVTATVNCYVTDIRTCFLDCINLTSPPSLPEGVKTMISTFKGCISLEDTPTIPSTVTNMQSCFYGCKNITTPPTLPSGLTSLYYCFYECTNLIFDDTNNVVIPNGVTNMECCFGMCNKMLRAPSIPASVTNMKSCFKGTNVQGNIDVYNTPSIYGSIFDGVATNLYIINHGSGETVWKNIASQNSMVHYEADDNPVPSLTFSVTRVGAMNSTTPMENGEYAYVKATATLYNTYLPRGWSVSLGGKVLKINGTTEFPLWTENQDGNTYTLECWRPLGDTAKRTFTMQVNDAIEDAGDTVMASHDSLLVTQILPKAYKLVDYFHDDATDTEGMSVGKFADEANLFDVDMPSRFRDSVIVDKLIGEIKMFAGENIPTGWHLCDGSELPKDDYPLLYNAIGDAWGTPVDSDNFVLPNLMGRVPVGCDENDTDFGTVGNNGGEKAHTLQQGECALPNHNHPANGNTYYLYSNANIAVNGTKRSFPSSGSNNHFVYSDVSNANITEATTTGARSANASSAHNNLQPYAVVNYIICCSV